MGKFDGGDSWIGGLAVMLSEYALGTRMDQSNFEKVLNRVLGENQESHIVEGLFGPPHPSYNDLQFMHDPFFYDLLGLEKSYSGFSHYVTITDLTLALARKAQNRFDVETLAFLRGLGSQLNPDHYKKRLSAKGICDELL